MNNEPLEREPIDRVRARLEALLKANAEQEQVRPALHAAARLRTSTGSCGRSSDQPARLWNADYEVLAAKSSRRCVSSGLRSAANSPKTIPERQEMARYFFHLKNGLTVEDVDGEEFDLVADARGHAVKVAQELGRHGSSLGGRSISVTDEQGAVVFKTTITDEK
jgi:uncharacterized lipoprotein NlpE involved in copper resistance